MIWSQLGLEGVGLGVGETHRLDVAMDSYFWQYSQKTLKRNYLRNKFSTFYILHSYFLIVIDYFEIINY